MHQMPQRTIVVQQQPRMIQPQVRHIVQQPQQQQQVQQTNVVRMSPIQRVQQPHQVTLTSRPRLQGIQPINPQRPRMARPRAPRPILTATPRPRVMSPNIVHVTSPQPSTPQKVSYIMTQPRVQTTQTQPRMIVHQTPRPQNRVVVTQRPTQRVVLQTTPRMMTPPPPPSPQQQLVTIKKTVAKPISDDPDDIESSITAAIVARKPDGTPLDPPVPVPQAPENVLKRPQPSTQIRPQMMKKMTGGQVPIISPAQVQKQEEEIKGDRESAKMLVILQSGEQRLITFTLPKECCTVQELLEQVGVPFSADSNIQCISNPGADIDYVVTVGVTVDSNELMVVAENTMKSPQVQQQAQLQTTPQIQLQTTPTANLQTVPKGIQQQVTTINQNEPKPKYLRGYLALCKNCGATSVDHARCQRCKHVFSGDVKIIPMQQSTGQSSKYNVHDGSDKKLQLINKRPMVGAVIGERGEMAARGRRPRVNRKVTKPEEPVILTLSSDDEDGEEKKEGTNSSIYSTANLGKNGANSEPLKFEPNPADFVDVKGELGFFTYFYFVKKIFKLFDNRL